MPECCACSSPASLSRGNYNYCKRCPEIRAGDTVALRSGGPVMTVTKSSGACVSVCWFDAQFHVKTEDFHIKWLTIVSSFDR